MSVKFPNNFNLKVTFLVSREIYEPILGASFLLEQQAVIDFKSDVLRVGRFEIPLVRRECKLGVNRVKALQQTVIKPRSLQIVKTEVVLRDRSSKEDEGWLLDESMFKPGIYMARSLHSANQTVTTTQILNTRDTPCVIEADQTLGDLHPVQIPTHPAEEVYDPDRWSERVEAMIGDTPEIVSEVDWKRLKDLLIEFPDIFSKHEDDLGNCTLIRHRIDIRDAQPIKKTSPETTPLYQEFIDKKIDALLKQKIIAPSTAPWAANVVVAKKKDGSLRLCIDTRGLNRTVIQDSYPLASIEASIDALAGSKLYTTLDLSAYYFQLALDLPILIKHPSCR